MNPCAYVCVRACVRVCVQLLLHLPLSILLASLPSFYSPPYLPLICVPFSLFFHLPTPPLLPKLSPSCLAYPLTISSSLPPSPSPSLHPSFSSSESEGSAGLCPRRCAGARGEEEGQGYQGQVRWLVLRRGCQQIQ